jgi:hypothetical protein
MSENLYFWGGDKGVVKHNINDAKQKTREDGSKVLIEAKESILMGDAGEIKWT